MSEIAIQVDSIWKKFRRGERQDNLRDLVPALVRGWMSRKPDPKEIKTDEFWALRDVSLTARRGEAIGIIGHNGAGKSTLLKVLTRLLRPTAGTYQTYGRVGALIEVTAGFHPDLTGRENVYLNGAILGMRKAEIARRFDEIVEFAGIGQFIDTPVKRYSSGMNARLGFSIAAHLEPDILIVDEVLSVGDYTFQGKCIDWMHNVLRNGTTVIFVSHNTDAVLSLCKSAVVLNQGRVLAQGPTRDVVSQYYRSGGSWAPALLANPKVRTLGFASTIPESGIVAAGERRTLVHTITATEDVVVSPGLHIKRDGRVVLQTTVGRMNAEPLRLAAGEAATIQWQLSFNLPAGVYELGYHVEDVAGGYHDYNGRASVVTIGGDPRVDAECYVRLELEATTLTADSRDTALLTTRSL